MDAPLGFDCYGTYFIWAEAVNVANQLRKEGYWVTVRQSATEEGIVHSVYVKEPK